MPPGHLTGFHVLGPFLGLLLLVGLVLLFLFVLLKLFGKLRRRKNGY